MKGARFQIPSTSALIAFEATARLSSVSLAADELNTSQPAVSRHIRNLETALGRILIRRSGAGIRLTKDGEVYFAAVKSSLEDLHAAGRGLQVRTPSLVIACSQEISALLLLPASTRLKRSLDKGTNLRIVGCDHDMFPLILPTGVDVFFEYAVAQTNSRSVRVLDEEIIPVCSSALLQRYWPSLARHPLHWSGIPRLELAHRNQGWASWETWFTAHDCEPPPAPVEYFENYLFLLEAASNGEGIALGWNGFVNGHFRTRRLEPVRDEWLPTKVGLYAVPTPIGERNPASRHFLKTLSALKNELICRVESLDHSAAIGANMASAT